MSKRLPKATLHTLDEIRRESGSADEKATTSPPPAPPPAGRPPRAAKGRTAKTAAATPRRTAAGATPEPVPEAASVPMPESTPVAAAAATPTPTAEPALPAPANGTPSPRDLHRMGAELIVERHTTYAALGGCVPLFVVDSLSVGLIIYNMLRSLAAHYRFQWRQDQLKATLAALLGGLLAPGAGSLTTQLLGKFIPGAWLFGTAASSLTAAACTRYVGETFIAHFESGGTLNNLDIAGIRASLRARIEAA
ncbi:MAG: DUF697 domain-containing protein [Rhodocyclaceae bacterium]|nr:DUF697 domain-containing protein [Rhodocyclaceae bacterium]